MRVSLADRARVKEGGYKVEKYGDKSWTLKELEETTGELMIGEHGCISPTEWEAFAEALKRIEQNEEIGRCVHGAIASFCTVKGCA